MRMHENDLGKRHDERLGAADKRAARARVERRIAEVNYQP